MLLAQTLTMGATQGAPQEFIRPVLNNTKVSVLGNNHKYFTPSGTTKKTAKP